MKRIITGALALAALGTLALTWGAPTVGADSPMRGLSFQAARGGAASQPQNTPGAQGSQGYTLRYSFTEDPTKSEFVASFTPEVKAIYAWATVTADGGAPEEQFEIDTQFIAPNGTQVDSQWYGSDTGLVTTYPEEATSFGDENVARKFINVAGTPNADLTGQWTVNFSVGGNLISSGTFTLASAEDLASSDTAISAALALENAGYEVLEVQELEGKNGTPFAYVIMNPASSDLYSSDTTQQIVDGLAALRQAYPNSQTLYVFLRYDPRYEIAYFTSASDVDTYLASGDFGSFARRITVDVYDNVEGKYLGDDSRDFINKNFGAGTYQDPPRMPLKTSTVGSVRVVVSPSNLPADGTSKAIVTVTVYDKRNKPLPDAEVTFEVTGSAGGGIRPRIGATDENGQVDAVYTSGKNDGTATITATSGNATGSGVVTVGGGSSDPAADNVIAYMATQGYQASDAGFMDDAKTSAGVLVELEEPFTLNDIAGAVVYGTTALRMYYPTAQTYAVVIPYQGNYLILPASKSAYDALANDIEAAQTEEDENMAFEKYLTTVFNAAVVVDANGNRLDTFKNFYNKNFTGG